MGLPKNYQQTVNLNKRVEALNDLVFYNFKYKVKLTNEVVNDIHDNNKTFDDLDQFLGKITLYKHRFATCENRISALNRQKADEKINEWLTKVIGMGVIESYEIVGVEERSFTEELVEQGLTDILNYKRD